MCLRTPALVSRFMVRSRLCRSMRAKSDDLPLSHPAAANASNYIFRLFPPQVEADIAPFRALLLGMFFMTVGFEIDLALCFNNLPLVASLVSSASFVPPVHASSVCVTSSAASRGWCSKSSSSSLVMVLALFMAVVFVHGPLVSGTGLACVVCVVSIRHGCIRYSLTGVR